jgi:nucleoside-diphosphate kinase
MAFDSRQSEQTLVLIKPDALRNSLTGYVLTQLSEFHSGLRFAAAKVVCVSKILAEEHYAQHRNKAFYSLLLDYIMGLSHYPGEPQKRRVIALVYQGADAVQRVRDIAGPTDPHVARERRPGSIRALGTVVPVTDAVGSTVSERWDNLVHVSITPAQAEREIKLWFRPNDFPSLTRIYPTAVSGSLCYFNNGRLRSAYEPGSVRLFAPGDIVWASDLEALRSLQCGLPAHCSVGAVAAKYLVH